MMKIVNQKIYLILFRFNIQCPNLKTRLKNLKKRITFYKNQQNKIEFLLLKKLLENLEHLLKVI